MKLTTPFAAVHLVAVFSVLAYFVGWQTAWLAIWATDIIHLALLGLQHLIRHPGE